MGSLGAAPAVLGRAVLRLRRRGLPRWRHRPAGREPAAGQDRRRGNLDPSPDGQVDHRAARGGTVSACTRSAGGSRPPCSASRASRLLYLLALRMWRSPGWAAFARRYLLAFDGLHIVQSRMAMLDIFLSTFIVAGFLFLVLDRERLGRAGSSKWRRTTRLFGSPWRLWAGVALGAAVATKWSGFYALALAVLLCAAWSLGRDGPRDRSRGSRDRQPIVAVARGGPAARLPRELRRVLLPARVRRPRLPHAASPDAAVPAAPPEGAAGELSARGPGRCCCGSDPVLRGRPRDLRRA